MGIAIMNNDTLTVARALGSTLDTNRVCDRCPGRTFCLDQPTQQCIDAAARREDEAQFEDYVDWRMTQLSALRGVL